MIEKLRNIAIIAHVDHGKTTLVDQLLRQSGTLDRKELDSERVMDSNDQEKERGITILAKNTALKWNGYDINIVDTPGHADFGGEVERVMSMVDCVLLVVDSIDGPMPQTRFVTQKAFAAGLRPIVVVNKIDRPGARPDWVVDQVFDLFDNLGATDEQLDFPIVFASALNGIAGMDHENLDDNMDAVFQAIVDHVPAPNVDPDGPFQALCFKSIFDPFAGHLSLFRVIAGGGSNLHPVNSRTGKEERFGALFHLVGKKTEPIDRVTTGDIFAVPKLKDTEASDTLSDPKHPCELAWREPPAPMISYVIKPKTRADEDKCRGALDKIDACPRVREIRCNRGRPAPRGFDLRHRSLEGALEVSVGTHARRRQNDRRALGG